MAFLTILSIIFTTLWLRAYGVNNSFNDYYSYLWGGDHFSIDPQGTQVQLKFDQTSVHSGYGAGFKSKWDYSYGQFHIKMKIPAKKTRGIVTSFYLTDHPPDNRNPGNHFEIDFEFLGTNGVVQTNVYNNDTGHREQSFKLWFDPSQDFHSYDFHWNPYQIVFFVDKIPVRVFKNLMGQGLAYPNKPMHIEASIWNAKWAGNVVWENAPFVAQYSDFGLIGCPARVPHGSGGDSSAPCDSDKYFWNRQNYRQLSAEQKQKMAYYRKKYMTYDYCSDPANRKRECSFNALET